jgi:lactoylglutathione lyase
MNLSNNIKGLQHLGLPVSNIENSKKWYVNNLGFKVIYETRLPSESSDTHVAFLELNGLVIEMYQLCGQELEEIKSRNHGHIDHIALDVIDIDDIFEQLKKECIATIEGAPKFLPFWNKGVKFLTILGPDNEKIEFNQKLD